MSTAPRSIVIVGAGFTGTVLAVNLLRAAQPRPLHIVLLDRATIGRGLAYARRAYPYLLNVPAGRMSANAALPGDFLAFARAQRHDAGAEDFLPRELYGDYLEALLQRAQVEAPAHVQLSRVRGQAIEVERLHRSAALRVHLADGRQLAADAVVLALGNPPAAHLAGKIARGESGRCYEDPWHAAATPRAGETVVVVGTGLTAADTILAGHHAAHGDVVFHAISRHGLLPPPQTPLAGTGHDEIDSAQLLSAAGTSVSRLVRMVRAMAQEHEAQGGDWRQAIGVVRELAPQLWQRLSLRERRRFLRHVRCYWEVHRHRLPAHVWETLSGLRRSGQLRIAAGRIVSLERTGGRVRVSWRPRGCTRNQILLADRVVNCTGPDYDVRRTRDRLMRTLLAQGLAVADPLGLGVLTDNAGALLDASGRAARNLFYVGPMLRATYWETTAVAELREHAARLARHLISGADNWQPVVPLAAQRGTSRAPA